MNPAIFLDRDGTLNVDVGYAHRLTDLILIENVCTGLRKLQDLGFRLFITTNQSGIARGYFGESQMHAFNDALCKLLQGGGITIDAVYHCPYHPTEGQGPWRRESPLRKPAPGMILRAARQHNLDLAASYAIGDKKSDVAAGLAAGCRTVLVQTGAAGASEPALCAKPHLVATDLLDAAGKIERHRFAVPAIPRVGGTTYSLGQIDGADIRETGT